MEEKYDNLNLFSKAINGFIDFKDRGKPPLKSLKYIKLPP